MITVIVAAAGGLLVGYAAGVAHEWHRVLDYVDRHLDRDPDWIRSGIAADEHHRARR